MEVDATMQSRRSAQPMSTSQRYRSAQVTSTELHEEDNFKHLILVMLMVTVATNFQKKLDEDETLTESVSQQKAFYQGPSEPYG